LKTAHEKHNSFSNGFCNFRSFSRKVDADGGEHHIRYPQCGSEVTAVGTGGHGAEIREGCFNNWLRKKSFVHVLQVFTVLSRVLTLTSFYFLFFSKKGHVEPSYDRAVTYGNKQQSHFKDRKFLSKKIFFRKNLKNRVSSIKRL